MESQVDRFQKMAEGNGWKGRVVPIGHLADLEEAVRGRYEAGLINAALYEEGLAWLSFNPPADLPGARSILVVAVPTPQMRLYFHWQGKRLPVVVPPTYVAYRSRTAGVQAVLEAWLRREGYGLAKPSLPLKTLAVCSGLAEYGRNNITYVDGMGSFLQLVGAFSDLPGDGDPWREPKALDRCGSCKACQNHCPTGAITQERFLLHAEACLTYHNEAGRELPDWIAPSWHHCLIGCLRCQTVCPENRAVRNWFEDRAEFTEPETALFLQRAAFDQLPAETATKVTSLEINEEFELLCRNLSLIIQRETRQS